MERISLISMEKHILGGTTQIGEENQQEENYFEVVQKILSTKISCNKYYDKKVKEIHEGGLR